MKGSNILVKQGRVKVRHAEQRRKVGYTLGYSDFPSTISKKYSYTYSMNPKIFISFLTYEYQKYAEFYANFKSMEII
jgi:hypothetical protein